MKKSQNKANLAITLSETDIQEILLGKMKTAALKLVTSLFEDDVERLCGNRFAHKSDAQFRRGGSEKTSIVVAGAKQPIKRPRVRGADGEVQIPSYVTLSGGDILDQRIQNHMVEGVSTRAYERVIEDYSEKFGVSKSSVSRAFVRGSQKDLDLINGQDLSQYKFLALMIDGIEFAKRVLVVALGITEDGGKVVLGLRDGASENKEVVTDLLSSIVERGFSPACEKLLVVLDGAKALSSAVDKVFAGRVLLQRCYLHKIKNLKGYLPQNCHPEMIRRMRLIMRLDSYSDAYVELSKLQDWLDTISTDAANSLREVGESLLTVHRLGITGELRRSLSSTNIIESVFSVVRTKCSRVKNWTNSTTTRMRWVASAAIAHRPRMRRVRGLSQLAHLKKNLNQLEKEVITG